MQDKALFHPARQASDGLLSDADVMQADRPTDGEPIELGAWLNLQQRLLWELVRRRPVMSPGEFTTTMILVMLSYGCGKPWLEVPRRGRRVLAEFFGDKYGNLEPHLKSLTAKSVIRISTPDGATRYQVTPNPDAWRFAEHEERKCRTRPMLRMARLAVEIARGQTVMAAILPDQMESLNDMFEKIELASELVGGRSETQTKHADVGRGIAGEESESQTKLTGETSPTAGPLEGLWAAAGGRPRVESKVQTKPPLEGAERSEVQTNCAAPSKLENLEDTNSKTSKSSKRFRIDVERLPKFSEEQLRAVPDLPSHSHFVGWLVALESKHGGWMGTGSEPTWWESYGRQWWKRLRANRPLFVRVWNEALSMEREGRIKDSIGAAANDLWKNERV